MTDPLPLFPVNTVLFPGAFLALRIFEARYLDLIGRCLRTDSRFGVCLIRSGAEVGAPATCFNTGTAARVVDWVQRADGLLGITIRGDKRFRVHRQTVEAGNLLRGEVEWLEEDTSPPRASHPGLRDLLAQVVVQTGLPYRKELHRIVEAGWLGYRLSELLPLNLMLKQRLLETGTDQGRRKIIHSFLVETGASLAER